MSSVNKHTSLPNLATPQPLWVKDLHPTQCFLTALLHTSYELVNIRTAGVLLEMYNRLLTSHALSLAFIRHTSLSNQVSSPSDVTVIWHLGVHYLASLSYDTRVCITWRHCHMTPGCALPGVAVIWQLGVRHLASLSYDSWVCVSWWVHTSWWQAPTSDSAHHLAYVRVWGGHSKPRSTNMHPVFWCQGSVTFYLHISSLHVQLWACLQILPLWRQCPPPLLRCCHHFWYHT